MTALPWSRPLGGRDPQESNRTTTPLALLLDLCFVVATSAAPTAAIEAKTK